MEEVFLECEVNGQDYFDEAFCYHVVAIIVGHVAVAKWIFNVIGKDVYYDVGEHDYHHDNCYDCEADVDCCVAGLIDVVGIVAAVDDIYA